jgi:hypothetical protein
MPNTSQVVPLEVACEGGLLLNIGSKDMPVGAATVLQNYESDVKGGYRRMSGYAAFDDNALTGSGQVLGIVILGARVIAARGANVEHSTGSGWTSITTARTSAGRYNFDIYNWTGTEVLIMASGTAGTNAAATWDGSTYTLMNGAVGSGAGTAPTNPTDAVEHKDHIFYLQGNKVTMSAPFNANDFTPASGAAVFTIPDTGVKLKSFRDQLYIFCEKSIYKLVGDSTSNIALIDVADDIGCVSGHTVQEIGGDLVFLAPDGLRTVSGTAKIDDVDISTLSKHIQERIKGLNETAFSFSSLLVRNKSQYRMWYVVPAVAEGQAKGIIGVIKQGEGGFYWEFSDTLGIKPSAAVSGYLSGVENVLHAGWDNGIVYKQEEANSFAGSNIASIFRSPDIIMQDSGLRKRIKRITFNIKYEGTMTPTLELEYDFGRSSVPQPAAYTMSSPSYISVYGGGVYGVSVYTLDPTALDRVWVIGSGFSIAIKIKDTSTNASFTILGFQIEYVEGGRK